MSCSQESGGIECMTPLDDFDGIAVSFLYCFDSVDVASARKNLCCLIPVVYIEILGYTEKSPQGNQLTLIYLGNCHQN